MSSLTANGPIFAGILILAALTSAAVSGVLIGNELPLLAALVLFAVVALCAALFPAVLFWGVLLLGFVGAGFARLYVPEAQSIRWLLLPASIGLAVHGLMSPRDGKVHFPIYIWFAIGFLVTLLFSAAINNIKPSTVFLGLKGYFQFYGTLIAMALLPAAALHARHLPRAFLYIGLLQVLLVIHQFFFIVPTRIGLGDGVIPIDVVAGSFGADWYGGGENSVLSAYMIVVLAGLITLWRHGGLRGWLLVCLSIAMLSPVFVTESKISLVYLLVTFLVLGFKDLVRHPLRLVGTICLGAVVIFALLQALITFAPAEHKVDSVADLFEYTWSYNVDADEGQGGQMSRAGAYRHWFGHQNIENFSSLLIGYGPGASRYADPGVRAASRRAVNPDRGVGRASALAVLWEGGLLALVCVMGMFATAFVAAGRLVRRYRGDPVQTAMLSAAQVAVAVLFVSFFDKGYFAFQIGYQALLVFALGYVALAAHRETSAPTLHVPSDGERVAEAGTLAVGKHRAPS